MGTKIRPGKFDCYDLALPDEPVFVLLGRDPDAPDRVKEWARRRLRRLHVLISSAHRRHYDHDEFVRQIKKVAEALDCADEMVAWRRGYEEVIEVHGRS